MTDDIRATSVTHAPSRLPKQVRRLALALTLAVGGFSVAITTTPAAHAASTPTITATDDGNGYIHVTGSGFRSAYTFGGPVTIFIHNGDYSYETIVQTTASVQGGLFDIHVLVSSGYWWQTDHLIAYDSGRHAFSNWSNVYVTCYLQGGLHGGPC